MKIVFKKPISIVTESGDKKTREEITLREPTIGNVMEAMKVFKNAESDYAAHDEFKKALISLVAMVAVEYIEQMRGRDVKKAFEYLETFPLYGLPEKEGDENKENDEDEILIPLDEPLAVKGGDVTEIVVREPILKDFIEAKKILGKNPIGLDITRMNVKLLCTVSDQTESVILRLPVSKYREAEAALSRFR